MPYIGQRPLKGDENNFKILDDISSYTLTFDGSDSSVVSAANDTITSLNHRFITGQRVTYNKGGGTVITGLSDGVYFIIKEDHNTIKLATSANNAISGTAVNITGVGAGSSHTLNVAFDGVNTKFKATHTNGVKAKVTRSAQLVISINGVIQQPHDSTAPSTGFGFDLDGVIVLSQAPASTDIFWAHVLTNNNVTFDISDNDLDSFTGDGSTTVFNLSKAPPDNRNVLVTIDGVVQRPNDPDGTTRAYSVVENVLTFASAPASGTEIQVRHIGFAGSVTGGSVTNFYGRTGNAVLKSTDNIVVGDATVTGDLTVNGTTTTLDTNLIGVDKIEVTTDGTNVAVAVTQNGSGDLIRLHDGTSQVVTVDDEGKVGIGTDNPSALLHLHGSSPKLYFTDTDTNVESQIDNDSSAGNFAINVDVNNSAGSNSNFLIRFNETHPVSAAKFLVNQTGKVGIGTDNPKTKLNVYTFPHSDTGGILVQNANYTSNLDKAYLIAGTQTWTGANTDWSTYGFQHKLKTDSNGIPRLTIDGAAGGGNLNEIITFKASGNVGIGSAEPGFPLEVYRNNTQTSNQLRIEQDGTGDAVMGFALTGTRAYSLGIDNSDSDKFKISTATTLHTNTLFTIDGGSGGNIGVGTDNPITELTVHSDTFSDITIHSERTSGNIGGLNFRKGDGATGIMTAQYFVNATGQHIFHSQGAEKLKITENTTNTVQVTGDLYASDDVIAGDEIRNNVPADLWASDNTFINLNGVGNITHMGGYETNITSNGYRDTNGQWVSFQAGPSGSEYTGAAQIGLQPQGNIIFRADDNKANGTSHNPSEVMRVTHNAYLTLGTVSARIGVGTASPNEILHLRNPAPIIKVDATNNASGLRIDVLGQTGGGNNQLFRVQRDGTTKFQLNDDGDVVITGDDNAELKLKAGAATGNDIIAFLNSSGTTQGNIFYDTDNNFMVFKTNGTASSNERLRITSTGQIITNGTANPFPTRGLTLRPVSGQTNNYLSIIAGNTSSVSGVTFGTSADNNANNYRAMFEYYHSGFAHNEGLRFLAAGTEALRIRGGTSNAGDILYGPGDHIIGASPGLINGLGSHNNANVASVLYGIDDGGGYNGMKVINFDDGTYNSQKIQFLTGKGGVSMATVRATIDENGKVGIGTDNPTAHLQVYRKTSFASNPIIQARSNNGSTNELKFEIDGDGDAYFNGKVGIGEASPDARLHISSPASTTCEIRLTANNTGSGSGDRGRINVYSSRNDGTAYQAGYVDIDRSNGTEDKAHLLVALNNGSGVGEKLRITSGGQVNIGGDYTQTSRFVNINGGSGVGQLQVKGTEADIWLHSTGSNGQWRILGSTGNSTHMFRVYDQTNSSQRFCIDSGGRSLFKTTGSQSTAVVDNNVVLQIAETSSSMCYFGANKGNSYGSIFGHHTAYGGTVIRNLTSDDISLRVANTNERLRIKNSGEVMIATRNSSNSGEHALRLGSFGIRTQDTGGYNWWRLESQYGSFAQFINLRADRRIGIHASNPQSRIDIAYDSNQNGNAFVQFRGPNNKSGEMLHKNIHNGASGGGTAVNLFEVTSWQSSNSRIFGVVKVMQVNPLSNQGCQAEGWFFKSDDGNADVGTMTKIHDKGGSIGSLSWSGDTLRYTTPTTAYLNMHVSVEYHVYDGGTVVFDTTSRSL